MRARILLRCHLTEIFAARMRVKELGFLLLLAGTAVSNRHCAVVITALGLRASSNAAAIYDWCEAWKIRF